MPEAVSSFARVDELPNLTARCSCRCARKLRVGVARDNIHF